MLWAVWLGIFLATEWVSFSANLALPEPRTRDLVVTIFSGLLTQLLTFMAYILLPRRSLEREQGQKVSNLGTIWRESGMDLVNESLCVAALVLLWALAFIVPGIFKSLRWGFVPYVVMTDLDYRAGRVHARNESNRLIKGLTPYIALIWAIFMGIEFGSNWLEGLAKDWHSSLLPFAWRMLVSVISFHLMMYALLLDFRIYELRRQDSKEKT